MDVTLHIGAHRTGTTTLQTYLQNNRDNLNEIGTEFWGPKRSRAGLFAGLVEKPADISAEVDLRGVYSCGMIRQQANRLAHTGLARLIVSEENMIGTMWDNLKRAQLYPDAKARLVRFSDGFGARCDRIVISIRSYDTYWPSVLAFMVGQGWPAPDAELLTRLTNQTRRWRDVIMDVSATFPDAQLLVWPFEGFVGQPDPQLALLNSGAVPVLMRGRRDWHNASPSCAKLRQKFLDRGETAAALAMPNDYSRWQPFNDQQIAAFQAEYAKDLNWLRQGADGLACFAKNPDSGVASIDLHPVTSKIGPDHEQKARRMGKAG